MKKLWIVASVCIVFCSGLFIYTEWDNKRFVKSLRPLPQESEKPFHHEPSSVKVQDNSSTISENRQKPEEVDIKTGKQTRLEETSNEDIWQTDQDSHDSNYDPNLSLEDIWQTDQDSNLSALVEPQNPSVSFADLSREEQLEVKYKMLLEQWGDIPEVQTYYELGKKKLRDKHLTLDEHIARTEAVLYLFPSERTEKSLRLMKWQKSKGPNFQLNLHDPELMRELRSMGVKEVQIGDRTLYTIE